MCKKVDRVRTETTEIYIHAADRPKTDGRRSSVSSSFVCSAYPCPSTVSSGVDYLIQIMATIPLSMGYVYSLQAEPRLLP